MAEKRPLEWDMDKKRRVAVMPDLSNRSGVYGEEPGVISLELDNKDRLLGFNVVCPGCFMRLFLEIPKWKILEGTADDINTLSLGPPLRCACGWRGEIRKGIWEPAKD